MDDAAIYFLDTNAASAFLRARDERLVARVEQHMEQLRLSSVVWAELDYGAKKNPQRRKYRENLVRLRERIPDIEPFDEVAAAAAADVRVYLEGLGEMIGKMDCLIAGHALSLGAVVVTHNVGEFRRVPTLRVEDWQSVR